jgi:8-oxo-dGTP diphosphatase
VAVGGPLAVDCNPTGKSPEGAVHYQPFELDRGPYVGVSRARLAFCDFWSVIVNAPDIVPAGDRRWHRQLARLLRRFPWSGRLVQRAYRVWQPRFTVGVVGVLLDGPAECVLLVEHIFHARKPWGLPGGWIARGEDPSRAAEREFLEETGLRVRAVCPLIVKRSPEMRRHLDMAYLCAPDGEAQTIRLNGELLGYRWARHDALPPLVAFHDQAIRTAFRVAGRVCE